MVENNLNFDKNITIGEIKLCAQKILSQCGIERPQTDVTAMLKHILKCDEIYLITHKNDVLPAEKFEQFKDFLKKRKNDVPLAYILGEKEFMSLKFYVDENTLIPRPDTETVVEEVIARTKPGDKLLDLCTGSGAIGISCAKYTSARRVVCVDKFEKTLAAAEKNARINGVSDVCEFIRLDVLENLADFGKTHGKFDICVSNPPYIETDEIEKLDKTVKNYEPKSALDGGKDGILFYRKIIADAEIFLKKGGILAFEIGFDQADAVKSLMAEKFENIVVKRDLGGNDRAVIGILR